MRYNITGMSCAACSARIEKAVSAVDGVDNVNVNLLLNTMDVIGTASDDLIIAAVTHAGYGASVCPSTVTDSDTETGDACSPMNTKDSASISITGKLISNTADPSRKIIRDRLIPSIILTAVLMYVGMGHSMLGLPLIASLSNNQTACTVVQMILAVTVMLINRKFFISGFKGLFRLAPNMDSLVALGSLASLIYGYFDSAAMIVTLITIGKLLEERAKGETRNAIKSLTDMSPKTAVILQDGNETVIPVSNLSVGDVFVVKAGSRIPVDGIVISGNGSVDESSLTGESIPADKMIDSPVSAATVCCSGYMTCRAKKIGEDTTFAQIIKMVSDAAAGKAPIAKLADKISGVFVPIVIGFAIITFFVWILLGKEAGYSVSRAISVLVVSCPCALGLATPVAIMVGNGVGAKYGILFKTAEALENTGKCTIAALDKTGTVTTGLPIITDIIESSAGKDNLLKYAYSLEAKSDHPLAAAICEYAMRQNIELYNTVQVSTEPGYGMYADISIGTSVVRIYGGNAAFIDQFAKSDDFVNVKEYAEMLNTAKNLAVEGKTPLLFSSDKVFLGIIAVSDALKEDSANAVDSLKRMGMEVCMLTGDRDETAMALGQAAGIDNVHGSLLPADKLSYISELSEHGSVIMIGDGINDAPALTAADIGMAIGAGEDIAIDAADVVLMGSSLSDAVDAIRLSRMTLKIIKQNLFWAFCYNIIGIPLAAGCFTNLTGWSINPMFCAAAMSISSFVVVSNALRLKSFRPTGRKLSDLHNVSDSKADRFTDRRNISDGNNTADTNNTIADNQSEHKEKKMKKTICIEGMMCNHCKATVEKALLATDGVSEVIVSLEENRAFVTLSNDVDDAVLKKAVEDHDFTVTGINCCD